jgi:hypothetical protein
MVLASLQKHTHLQTAKSQHTDQSLQKSVLLPTQEKLFLKNFQPFKKIKIRNAHNPRLTSTLTTYIDITIGHERRRASANK